MISGHSSADIFADYIRAGQSDTKPDELRKLARSSLEKIRTRVAENISTPLETLEQLATDASSDVRIAVCCNPAVPYNVLRILARDQDPTVRYAMAENPEMHLRILKFLRRDSNPYVSVRAQRTLDSLPVRINRRTTDGLRLLRTINEQTEDKQFA